MIYDDDLGSGSSSDFEIHEELCYNGYHCSCFNLGDACCFCDRVPIEIDDAD